MKTSELRQTFIEYFKKHGHTVVPSSSLIPDNDPTLLFTNAGMVQFKNLFLGQESRSYSRAVSAQRCVRAGGKHNDLDNVGYTARHHTFFEMLGNFSFGDYFKRDAIKYAWQFLTQVLNIPEERLWVTVYKDDQEAADLWLNDVGVSPLRFSRCGDEDNFWSMGDTGPCGPCSEIFYDHGPKIAGGPPGSADADGDRYVEIWNLVFMQFNRDQNGKLHPLPKPSVDTGMGLERIAAVMQGVCNNYDIDLFVDLINAIRNLSTRTETHTASFNVIADHIRSCAFLIVDGARPSPDGRGYVLRRIMRRAIRHGHKCHISSPFLHKLVQPLIAVMGDTYPELITQRNEIEQVLIQEEQQFARTLEQGLRVLQEELTKNPGKDLAGEVAFKLYDTYGFPFDLTQDVVRENGLHVDHAGFLECMQKQKQQSQSASQFNVDYMTNCGLDLTSIFHGYTIENLNSTVEALIIDGKVVNSASQGSKVLVVLKDTPFYAESGGQVGDQGQLLAPGIVLQVQDTQKRGGTIIHDCVVLQGELTVNTTVEAQVNTQMRQAIRLNHTATHMLHAVLHKILGSHVQQRGSLVEAVRARFDFTHKDALSAAQIAHIESIMNLQIRENHAVITEVMALEDAKNSGAIALFGEKYSEDVRVLSLGDFSKELCGGTHASRTGDLGLFKIVAEYGVASGIRRIEFVTGEYACSWVNEQLQQLEQAASLLKTQPTHVSEKITQILHNVKEQEKELSKAQQANAQNLSKKLLQDVQVIGEVEFLVKQLDHLDMPALRSLLDQLKSELDSAIIVLFSVANGNISVVAGVSKSLLGKVPPASVFVKHLCGKGGGRDDLAQGGGVVPQDLADKISSIYKIIA
jgi:alanyl-tRNA synthetase